MNKITGLIIITVVAIGGIVMLRNGGRKHLSYGNQANVTTVDGKQIIQINAKGGYAPRVTVAKRTCQRSSDKRNV